MTQPTTEIRTKTEYRTIYPSSGADFEVGQNRAAWDALLDEAFANVPDNAVDARLYVESDYDTSDVDFILAIDYPLSQEEIEAEERYAEALQRQREAQEHNLYMRLHAKYGSVPQPTNVS